MRVKLLSAEVIVNGHINNFFALSDGPVKKK